MEYKVGDIVELKSLNKIAEYAEKAITSEGFYFLDKTFYMNSIMYDYLEKKYKIKEINTDGFYTLEGTNGWVWDKRCFKNTKKQLELEF